MRVTRVGVMQVPALSRVTARYSSRGDYALQVATSVAANAPVNEGIVHVMQACGGKRVYTSEKVV